jgi:hypothetical protein
MLQATNCVPAHVVAMANVAPASKNAAAKPIRADLLMICSMPIPSNPPMEHPTATGSSQSRNSQHPTNRALNMDGALAPSSMDAVRAEADIVCSVGTSCRARARFPCIVQML